MTIAVNLNAPATDAWQQELARAVRDPAELLRLLELSEALLPAARRAAELFPLRVPRGFVARMVPGELNDPLLRQVLPLDAECRDTAGFSDDPVGDLAAQGATGVLHKYHGRALLVTTGACAVNCRYCFRRHFPYSEAQAGRQHWQAALDYLRRHPEITEIILSGGDPLSLNARRLDELVAALEELPQLKRLRIHSRLPVVLPARIDERLLRMLEGTRLQTVMVIHANHAQELDDAVGAAMAALRGVGVHLLNQAVLLRGVNDRLDDQVALSERLFEHNVLPYYLHLLDRVRGASHFEVPEQEAEALWRAMAAHLPGYLVPKLVREIPGEPNKTLVAPGPTRQS